MRFAFHASVWVLLLATSDTGCDAFLNRGLTNPASWNPFLFGLKKQNSVTKERKRGILGSNPFGGYDPNAGPANNNNNFEPSGQQPSEERSYMDSMYGNNGGGFEEPRYEEPPYQHPPLFNGGGPPQFGVPPPYDEPPPPPQFQEPPPLYDQGPPPPHHHPNWGHGTADAVAADSVRGEFYPPSRGGTRGGRVAKACRLGTYSS